MGSSVRRMKHQSRFEKGGFLLCLAWSLWPSFLPTLFIPVYLDWVCILSSGIADVTCKIHVFISFVAKSSVGNSLFRTT